MDQSIICSEKKIDELLKDSCILIDILSVNFLHYDVFGKATGPIT